MRQRWFSALRTRCFFSAAERGQAPAGRPADAFHDVVEGVAGKDGAFAAHLVGVDLQQALHLGVAGSALSVPRAGAHRNLLFVVLLLRRERNPEQSGTAATDDDDRAVLPLRRVVLVRHPRPHHLTGVGVAVHARFVRHDDAVAVDVASGRWRRRPNGFIAAGRRPIGRLMSPLL